MFNLDKIDRELFDEMEVILAKECRNMRIKNSVYDCKLCPYSMLCHELNNIQLALNENRE